MALDPITAGFELGGKLIDRFMPNKAEADMAKLELAKMALDGELTKLLEASKLSMAQLDQETRIAEAQTAINKADAESGNWVQTNWRPMFGWVCVIAFAWNLVLGPMAHFVLSIFGVSPGFTEANMETMLPALFGILGFGAYRTYERVSGSIPKGK
jgi:hypothetical protein